MKKQVLQKVIVTLFAAALAIGTISCKKCRECTATDYEGYVVAYEEQCAVGPGAKKTVDDFETDFRNSWSSYYVTCVDKK